MKRIPLPLVNPIERAMSGVSKLKPEQVAKLMEPNNAAVQALQFGRFDREHWKVLADAFNIAEQFAKPPVNLANDHASKFQEAQNVLFELADQHRTKQTWTARAAQLQTIKDAMEIFQIQLEYVAVGEFERTIASLTRKFQQALAGNSSARLVMV